MTQERLSEAISKDASFLDQVEIPNICRAISLDTLLDIAVTLNVSPYKLLNFDDDI